MELTSNGNFWETYTLEDARGFLHGEAVGASHPSRIAVHEYLKEIKKPITLLEVPCAAGAEYPSLKSVSDVTCMDRTPVMLEALKLKYPDVKTVQGDIREIPLKDNSFDWVYARAIFEHLPSMADTKLAMQECFRVAKEGCIFSFFIPPDKEEKIDWNGKFFNNTYKKQDVVDAFRAIGVKTVREEYILAPNHLDNFLIFYVRKV